MESEGTELGYNKRQAYSESQLLNMLMSCARHTRPGSFFSDNVNLDLGGERYLGGCRTTATSNIPLERGATPHLLPPMISSTAAQYVLYASSAFLPSAAVMRSPLLLII